MADTGGPAGGSSGNGNDNSSEGMGEGQDNTGIADAAGYGPGSTGTADPGGGGPMGSAGASGSGVHDGSPGSVSDADGAAAYAGLRQGINAAIAAEPVSPDVATIIFTLLFEEILNSSYMFPRTCIAISLKANVGP